MGKITMTLLKIPIVAFFFFLDFFNTLLKVHHTNACAHVYCVFHCQHNERIANVVINASFAVIRILFVYLTRLIIRHKVKILKYVYTPCSVVGTIQ